MPNVRSTTKILVDGGDPEQTLRIRNLLGYVDGQTSNPTYVAKNPEVQRIIASAENLLAKDKTTSTGRSFAGSHLRSAARVFPSRCATRHMGKHDAVLLPGPGRSSVCRNQGHKGTSLVYVSPFVGRLDDRGEDGMSLVANIKKMCERRRPCSRPGRQLPQRGSPTAELPVKG
jgi:transaldolase